MTYIFDRNFDVERDGEPRQAPCAARPMFTEDDLRAAERLARAEGFEAGRSRGRTEAEAEAGAARAQERQDALLAIAGQVETFCRDAAGHRAALECQMLDFAIATCERLIPELLRTRSVDRAAAEVKRCLSLAIGSPRIRIFLSRAVLDLHGAAIEKAILERDEGTKVELAADPALADGDARVEWDNGVMEYSFGRIAEQVLDALHRTRPLPAEGIADGRLAHG
ncbi:FliH/SctL family protein [Roseibacterium sp. SDUM158017]|uniref:FliH/SctL family protein n=1 Tax=Roseicyclus salinarum TaxID=3036773 RepID=UPI0024157BF8|nr:FliH/SctL family protein [Roseibacterium sp. SDUM158017]MDG4648635.1 FliH/SctL family protein [Roseibacterium sp. SDUM158017]